jgi:hypothetical protein
MFAVLLCRLTCFVYRVQGFLSSHPNWAPHSLTRKEVLFLPHLGPRGKTNPLAGEGGGPNAMMKNPSHAAVPLNPSKARDVGRSQQWQLQTPLFCSTKSPHQIQKTFWLPRRNFYPCSPPPPLRVGKGRWGGSAQHSQIVVLHGKVNRHDMPFISLRLSQTITFRIQVLK